MRILATILAMLATAASAEWYVDLPGQRLLTALPATSAVSNPNVSDLLAKGYRRLPARKVVPDGYRYGTFAAIQDPDKATQAIETTLLINLDDEAAANEAAEAAAHAAEIQAQKDRVLTDPVLKTMYEAHVATIVKAFSITTNAAREQLNAMLDANVGN